MKPRIENNIKNQFSNTASWISEVKGILSPVPSAGNRPINIFPNKSLDSLSAFTENLIASDFKYQQNLKSLEIIAFPEINTISGDLGSPRFFDYMNKREVSIENV
ncbi:hypothetical protein HK096_001728, partial [Nowakowskiella sp. JEL0078]